MKKWKSIEAIKASPDQPETVPPEGLAAVLGRRIVQLRRRRAWSQGDLARRLGVTRERVGNWERGENRPPLESLAALGEAFRVPLDELVLGRRRGRWLNEEELQRARQLLAELSELFG